MTFRPDPRWLLALLLAAGCGGSGTIGDDDAADDDDSAIGDDDDSVADDDDSAATGCAPEVTLAVGMVRTSGAVLTGEVDGDGVAAFLGVPFAEPPVGALRLRAPVAYACRDESLDASEFGPACPQPDADGALFGDEDCLSLNVFTPGLPPPGEEVDEPVPVLFFIHGGGNVQGSASVGDGYALYDGSELARRFGVVVVTVQYRLGALGFLALELLADEGVGSGNFGLMDQTLALQWTQENIGSFGGDPERVLLFGESAGAVDVCSLLVAPDARGLFAAAIMQSGACNAFRAEQAQDRGATLVEELGCADAGDPLDCLRGLGASAFAALSRNGSGAGGLVGNTGFGPTVDGAFLPLAPGPAIDAGEAADVPIILGTNRDETAIWIPPGSVTAQTYEQAIDTLFGELAPAVHARYPVDDYESPRWAWIRLTGDAQFHCPTRRVARGLRARLDSPVRRYLFTHQAAGATGTAYGAYHGLELVFAFQAVDAIASATGYQSTAADAVVEDLLGSFWTNFAATGDPNGGDLPLWEAYGTGTDRTMRLDAYEAEMIGGVRPAFCDFWDGLIDGAAGG